MNIESPLPIHESWLKIQTVEMHTGGEPLRIILDGLPELPGDSILEVRRYFRDNLDHIRTGLMWEPRGHADMYGAIITRPFTPGADFGAFFLHNEGYSTMCGHATIALTKFVLESGLVKSEGDHQEVNIDAPPGLIRSTGHKSGDIVERSSFMNVPSFVLLKDEEVDVDGIGTIRFDVAYGGAFYAFVRASDLDLNLSLSEHAELIDLGRRIKKAVVENFEIKHPFEEDLSFLYGTIFTGKAIEEEHHSRNVCIFADGELDRSATGSGVSARAALHHARSELMPGERITIESILGTTMDVEIKELTTYGGYQAVIPEVSGAASYTGFSTFVFDPEDALNKGFILR